MSDSIYKLCKRIIEYKNYESKEDMKKKLDAFYSYNRITDENYKELMKMLELA